MEMGVGNRGVVALSSGGEEGEAFDFRALEKSLLKDMYM